MSDRKAEMERKRARLLALRQEQQQRREAREKQDATEAAIRCAADLARPRGTDDALLNGLARSRDDTSASVGDGPSKPQQVATPTDLRTAKQRMSALSVQTQAVVNYPPREPITYSKHTQTRTDAPEDLSPRFTPEQDGESIKEDEEQSSIELVEPSCKAVESEDATTSKVEEPPPIRLLTKKEQARILGSEEFHKFFDRSTKMMERALGTTDIFTDYTRPASDEQRKQRSSQLLTLCRPLQRDAPAPGVVTSLDWCAHLLLGAYAGDRATDEGACCVWDAERGAVLRSLSCATRVQAGRFVLTRPHLLLGGTYSGQVVLWDTREARKLPVLQSMLWSGAHTQPVHSLNMIGGRNSHDLVSTSSNSQVCVWSLDMLTKPQEIVELSIKGGLTVAPTCVDFPNGETNNFVIGAEEGSIYYATLRGEKPGVTHHFSGHAAPVSGISAVAVESHPHKVYLTSSFDWTVKLWSARRAEPIRTFADYADVVYDVAWSPTHPGVFATADGDGRLQIWNLCEPNFDCMDVPVATATVQGAPALNKVAWATTGRQVAVGDDQGRLWVYDVGDRLANPTTADWSALAKTLGVEKPQDQIARGIAKLKTHIKKEMFPY